MTPADLFLAPRARREAEQQYVKAAERLAERSINALQNGKPMIAKALALFANDVRRWGRSECQ